MLYSKIYGISCAAIADIHFNFLKSRDERRFFEYFQYNTREQINYTFGSSTEVLRLIQQASHSDESIRYTVIALGSLTEYLGKTKIIARDDSDGRERLRYAQIQYTKAISQLSKDISAADKPPKELILTCCLLLGLFDFLSGEEANGRTHLAAGLQILQQYYPLELRQMADVRLSELHQPNSVIHDFAHIFSELDLHASIWLGLSSFCSQPLMLSELPPLPPSIDSTSLDDVSTLLHYQIIRAHVFHHNNAHQILSTNEESPIPFHILAEKNRLLYELHQWPVILTHCLSTMPPLTSHLSTRVALLRMNHRSLLIELSAFLIKPSSSFYDSFDPSFTRILSDAKFVLESTRNSIRLNARDNDLIQAIGANFRDPDPTNMSMFAFVAGAIQPLYLTARRCTDKRIREEAIELLGGLPWREGAWDSLVMARFAKNGLQEENGARLVAK